jgi:hypothetical protein
VDDGRSLLWFKEGTLTAKQANTGDVYKFERTSLSFRVTQVIKTTITAPRRLQELVAAAATAPTDQLRSLSGHTVKLARVIDDNRSEKSLEDTEKRASECHTECVKVTDHVQRLMLAKNKEPRLLLNRPALRKRLLKERIEVRVAYYVQDGAELRSSYAGEHAVVDLHSVKGMRVACISFSASQCTISARIGGVFGSRLKWRGL